MATVTITESIQNVRSKITKEDNTNVDILTLTVPSNFNIFENDLVVYQDTNLDTLFKGYVQTRKVGNGYNEVLVYDLGAELLKRLVNEIFTSMSPEAIIEYIIVNYTSLTYVSTISSGVTISSYVAKDKKAWDVVTELVEILQANFYVDVEGNFMLELEGTLASSQSITTNTHFLDGEWVYSLAQQVNIATVIGDRLIQEKTENFAGPATSVTLSEIPISVNVTVGGVEKTGYISGSGSGDYTVDKENKTINFDSSSSTIVVKYTYEIPIKVRRRDYNSIQLYGNKEEKFEKPYIKSRNEARKYAQYIIDRYANPLTSSTWINLNNASYNAFNFYLPNQTINVTDNINNISGNFIIKKVEREFPGNIKITVGTPEDDIAYWSKDVLMRVKQLEEKDDNSDIITEDEQIEEDITIGFDSDVVSLTQRVWASDAFYALHDENGIRNQATIAGTYIAYDEGNGYTDTDLTENDILVAEDSDTLITESGNTFITESGTTVTSSEDIVTNHAMNTAKTNFISSWLSTITHIATGDDDTTPLATDTTLGNETIVEATYEEFSGSDSITIAMFQDTTENNSNNIKEVGLKDGSSGNLYQHSLTNLLSKTSSLEVFIEVKTNVNVKFEGGLL